MSTAIVVIVLVALFLSVGAVFALAVQADAKVQTPAGDKYRIQMTPTGVPWVTLPNWDLSWSFATFGWVRHLRRNPRTWTVSVYPAGARGFWRGNPVLLSEQATSRRVAGHRLDELADAIRRGDLSDLEAER